MSNVKLTRRFRSVIPMLVCSDAASEPDGTVVQATMAISEAMLMIHGEFPALASRAPQLDGSSPVVIYLYVEDVDAMVNRALGAQARVLLPVANQFWGDRVGRIIDPAGHVWNVATRIEAPFSRNA